jgi:hypothetical protein
MRMLLVCLFVALTLASCASKRTVVTSRGAMTVETDAMHNTVKVSNARGTAVIGKGAVNATALGLPLYPGAIASETGGMATNTSSGTSDVVSLATKDSFDQVYTWYKARMPSGSEQTHMLAAGGSVASFEEGKLGDKDQKSVVITESGGKTTILLTHTVNM